MDKYAEGQKAEVAVREYLKKQGFDILETNVGYKNAGELDIIAMDGGAIVFVEVRYRSSREYGHPLETLTEKKRRSIVKAAACYMSEKKPRFSEIRFDVAAVTDKEIEYIKNAFYSGWN